MPKHVINEGYAKRLPNNCPVVERTADGVAVGVCAFYLKDGMCPRHGNPRATLADDLLDVYEQHPFDMDGSQQ